MAHATYHFPRGFLWGTATASHQVEGNNTNNQWWAWEQLGGKIKENHQSIVACEWSQGRWREDFERASETNQNAHRLSIEWSKVQPAEDQWDESELDRYLEMLRSLTERKMVPLVTLNHFSIPIWLSEQGGWENPETAELFEHFTRRVVKALKDYTSYWITINEPNVYAFNSYLLGDFPPGKNDLFLTIRVLINLLRGHARSYHAIHEIQPTARVGIAHHYRPVRPAAPWSILDRTFASLMDNIFNNAFPRALDTGRMRTAFGGVSVPEAKDTQDFFGLNYYTSDVVHFNLSEPGFVKRSFDSKLEVNPSGFIANDPDGFYESLRWANQFDCPILITENGVDDSDDTFRPKYLIEHIYQMWRAVNAGIPIKGYFHWTLVDNFEWERGWTQRFGLWELDPDTQERKKRPSADLYASICETNGISAETVARYTPALFEKLFPN
jgi:beta-glucosidase